MKNIYEFKSDQLNFDLQVDHFDCVEYVSVSDICELILKNPGDSIKKEWVKEFTSLPNLKVSYSSVAKTKIFVPLTKEILNDLFSKNSFSTAFIFNSIVEYVVSTWKQYTPSESAGEEKKSLI